MTLLQIALLWLLWYVGFALACVIVLVFARYVLKRFWRGDL